MKFFFKEVSDIFNILSSNLKKNIKFDKISDYIKKSKKIFKGVSGVGMNYYTGYKIK